MVMSRTTENAQKYTRFYRFLLFTPFSIESSQFLSTWMTFNNLKTNCTKLAHYKLKIRKVIELFDFQTLMQYPLWRPREDQLCTEKENGTNFALSDKLETALCVFFKRADNDLGLS